jgi:thiamine kinase
MRKKEGSYSLSQIKGLEIGLEIINKLNNYHKNKLIKICPDVSISDIEPVLLHTDVVPGNLILGDKGLQLIDWQCPAIGDPIVDIMMFLLCDV